MGYEIDVSEGGKGRKNDRRAYRCLCLKGVIRERVDIAAG